MSRAAPPIAAAVAAAIALLAPPLRADPVAACADAALRGQEARERRALRSAREEFVRCAAAGCPAAVRNDCLQWLAEVEHTIPTAVFFADVGGTHDVTDVRVSVDGVALVDRLDGRSVPVEPGERRVRFERPGSPPQERSVLFVEGEKNRKVTVHFPAPASGARGGSPWPWVAGAVSAASFVSFGAFALAGSADVRALERCEPRCATSDVQAARTKYFVADVSLGLAVVSLGVATYLFLTAPHAKE